MTVAQNFDFSVAKHMLRAGVLVEGGWWDSTQQTNANGTFTFSSLRRVTSPGGRAPIRGGSAIPR